MGSVDAKDRFFATLPYVLPLIYVVPFGQYLFQQFPALQLIYLPIQPLLQLYSAVPFIGLIAFIVLLFFVVRNDNISHFIRFNTMQAILLDILLILLRFASRIFGQGLQGTFLLETLYNVVFLGMLAACIYAIVQSALGRYAEIPAISEAVNGQVR